MNHVENKKLVLALARLVQLYDRGNLMLEHYDDLDQAQDVQEAIEHARLLTHGEGHHNGRSSQSWVGVTPSSKPAGLVSPREQNQQRIGPSSAVPERERAAGLLRSRLSAPETPPGYSVAER